MSLTISYAALMINVWIYMVEMIRERQAMVDKMEGHDLLRSLLEANDHDLDLWSSSENEIITMSYLTSFINVDSIRFTMSQAIFPCFFKS
jgi:hypothetical protein